MLRSLKGAPLGRWILLGVLTLAACKGSSGKNGEDGVNGSNGDGGTVGQPSLILISNEPSGAHCAAGGQRIDTGLDANGNGKLDPNEVTASTYVCNGEVGADGADGSPGEAGQDAGAQGEAGLSSLIRTSSEPPGANCAHGGVRVETGVDADGDGVLEDDEVNAAETQFLCNPPGVGGCSAGAALAIAGDYAAADGTEHWLRQTATATTYTMVPAGAPVPTAPPQLFRVEESCGQWLLLHAPDGTLGRLDWANVGGGLRICVRMTATAEAAAALSAPNPDVATGCAAGPWAVLTKETP